MKQNKIPVLDQGVTLRLINHLALSCSIKQLFSDGVHIAINDSLEGSKPTNGDIAELHIEHSAGDSLNTLKIQAIIRKVDHNSVRLDFISIDEEQLKGLEHWCEDHIPANSHKVTDEEINIIHQLSDIFLKQFANLMDVYLELVDSQIFKLAESAKSSQQQNRLFEIKHQFRQHGEKIKQLSCSYLQNIAIDQELTSLSNSFPETANSVNDMELIDLKEFEDWLSLETIIRRANDRYYEALGLLEKRYSHVLHKVVNTELLPFSINNICCALQDTIKNFKIDIDLLPIVYHFFDEAVISQLESIYDQLNAKFKNSGILPNLESHGLYRNKPHTTGSMSEESDGNLTDLTATQAKNRVILNNNTALFSAVNDILALLKTEVTSESEPSKTISSEQLVDMLSTLQQDTKAVDALTNGRSIRDWLGANCDFDLPEQSSDMLNLVETIFKKIFDYRQISPAIADQLKRLEVPVAKTALMDREKFFSPEHPAHQLLNQLLDISLNSEMPNKALEKKFNGVVSSVTENFESSDNIFQQGLSELSPISLQQKNACARNAERIAQTYDGRQRIQQAEEAVDREIQCRVSPPYAPEIIIELLDNGWRELLKLTYIKSGKNSTAWQENLATLDQLLYWLTDADSEDTQSQTSMERELEADSFAELIDQQLNNVSPGNYRHQNTVEKIRDTLKGEREVILRSLGVIKLQDLRSPNDLQRELEAANPHLARWFKRAKNLEIGQEFTQLNDNSGKKNIKLVWIGKSKQHFVFINNRGQKVFDFDLVDLAIELSNGLTPADSQSEWSLVDRGIHSTIQQAYEQLAFKNMHDELTGLINRKECERLLGKAVVDANNAKKHCLLYIDIDKFSLVNELYGHVAGDQLLVEMSRVLECHFPDPAVVARMAGNEFVILLNGLDEQEHRQLADNFRRQIDEQQFEWQEHKVQLTISIGLIAIDKYSGNVIDLLRNAVSACQIAKGKGGSRIHYFKRDTELHDRRQRLLTWIDNLNNLFSSDRLVLRAQKISPLKADENESHYEILLAIKNDDGELTSPIEFIEAAECYNRMQRVDRWVIENTFIWLNTQIENNKTVPSVSINLSANSINDETFMDFVLQQFAQYNKVRTSKICFEVTETSAINCIAEAADFIREIKKIGCKFSLDDFGSGNASYQYLKHLPVDYIKIDGMFVKEIHRNKNDYALVKSINEIAHLMGKHTIAEYAESEEVINSLSEIGVDYIQGFAIGKPIVLDELCDV